MPLHEALRVSEIREYDPDTGATLVKTYTGTKAQIDIVEAYWSTLNYTDNTPTGRGYKTTKTETSSSITLVVRIPDDILYTDNWGVDSETGAKSLFWSSQIRTYLGFPVVATPQSTLDIAFARQIAYINACAAAIAAGADPFLVEPITDTNYQVLVINQNLNPGADPTAAQRVLNVIYTVIRESGFIDWKSPVLKRNRLIPFAVSGRTQLVGPPNVYTTAALIDEFDIPDEIVAQIETADNGVPQAQVGTTWGWKLRRDDSNTMIGFARTTECRDWVYGNYSDITHNIFT